MTKDKELTNNEEEIDNTEDKKEMNVKSGLLLFKTEDDKIVFQPYEDLDIFDITVFSEYLNRLKDKQWEETYGIKNKGDIDEA